MTICQLVVHFLVIVKYKKIKNKLKIKIQNILLPSLHIQYKYSVAVVSPFRLVAK